MIPIKDIVENPHTINQRYTAFWYFLLQSYEGGVDYSNSMLLQSNKNPGVLDSLWNYFVNGIQQNNQTVKGNLFIHPKERIEDFNRRTNMSYYYNFCSPIIDIYGDHLFKQAVIEDFKEIKGTIDQVKDNIDQQGSSIEEFRKQMADMAQLYGHCFVIVDSPKIQEPVETRADQIEKRAFPYLCLYPPMAIKNWSLDEYGKPYWVLVEETKDGNKDVANFQKNSARECFYRLWTREGWILYNDKYEFVDEDTHDLGEVPIVCVFAKKSKKARNFLGISDLADIAFIARDIYNASSELRQILRDQTFAFLAVQGTSDEYSDLALGTGKGLLYPEGRNVPQYVAPPSDNAKTYFDHIDRQIQKIYQIAKLDSGGVSATSSGSPSSSGTVDNQSGASKAWDFNQTNSSLSSKSSNLEDAEMKIWQLFAKWEGAEFTGNVQYPNEFSISSLRDDLTEAEQEARVVLGKTFDAEVRKAIIRKKFPRKSDKDIAIMDKEIDTMGDLKEKQAKDALKPMSMADRIKQNTATGGQNRGFGNGN